MPRGGSYPLHYHCANSNHSRQNSPKTRLVAQKCAWGAWECPDEELQSGSEGGAGGGGPWGPADDGIRGAGLLLTGGGGGPKLEAIERPSL